jgi:hypothetical protein
MAQAIDRSLQVCKPQVNVSSGGTVVENRSSHVVKPGFETHGRTRLPVRSVPSKSDHYSVQLLKHLVMEAGQDKCIYLKRHIENNF